MHTVWVDCTCSIWLMTCCRYSSKSCNFYYYICLHAILQWPVNIEYIGVTLEAKLRSDIQMWDYGWLSLFQNKTIHGKVQLFFTSLNIRVYTSLKRQCVQLGFVYMSTVFIIKFRYSGFMTGHTSYLLLKQEIMSSKYIFFLGDTICKTCGNEVVGTGTYICLQIWNTY